MSTDNGVIEMNNVKIESDEQNCIHSKPRKDYYKLKEELSLRIAAKRKEELKKKQMCTIEIPMEDSDSDYDVQTNKGEDIENSNDMNGGNNKENYESDVEIGKENGNISENDAIDVNDDDEKNDGNESDDENNEEEDDDDDEEEESEVPEEVHIDSDGCEIGKKTKPRKRIILMDNSDDDEISSDG